MGWIHAPETLHNCVLPKPRVVYAEGYPIGSIWECDICSQHWELKSQQLDGLYFKRSDPVVKLKKPVANNQ